MTRRAFVPAALLDRPFTRAEALRAGLTVRSLAGPSVRRCFTGVYVAAGLEATELLQLRAASLVLPLDAAVSHLSGLHQHGVGVGPARPLHFSTNTTLTTRQEGIVLHRRQGRLSPSLVRGLATLGPDRCFVDAATMVSFVQLVTAGDWLIHLRHTSRERLCAYTMRSHLDGVLRARRAVAYVRERVESPRETVVRLMLVFARLPEPATNLDILDAAGRFVARGDLPYLRYRVLVEYDGWQHERDARQRRRDVVRRERLEALGWRVIVVTAADLANPRAVVHRVYAALLDRGYDGPPPHFNVMWGRWFG